MCTQLSIAILAFLSGSMAGAVVTQLVTSHREKQARLADFRGFLGGWLGSTKITPDVSGLHRENLKHLWGYYGKVYRDFGARKRTSLRRVCDELSAMQSEQHDFRETVVQKIEALVDLV